MQFQLGQYIRKRYEGFLNKEYNTDEIYVMSSDKDRTIQSAMANMAGLYPPLTFNDPREQFVPVHSLSYAIDNVIIPNLCMYPLFACCCCPPFDTKLFIIPSLISSPCFSSIQKIAFSRKCPRYGEEFDNGLHRFSSEVEFNTAQEPLYKFLTEQTGFPVISYYNVSDIYDTLFVQVCTQ